MKLSSKILSGLAASVLSISAQATLIGVSGAGAIISSPGSVLDDAANCYVASPNECLMIGFDERQGVTLGSDLSVDGGVIAAGTVVNSHMIFLNTPGNARAEKSATWTFAGSIVGVMSDSRGNLEAASSLAHGALGTTYPANGFNARGYEGNDSYNFAGSELTANMVVTEPGDWIRVITVAAVPEPATLGLLGLGLAGFAASRRKR